ncbi:hypothetical protein [Natronosalvus vescus]|uniref:hypothetical protein n=1 Tax=Natronosalvus vescus TaxID=2953881 RepID=UPI0020907D2E|nr:hypothetical protein [Natronosalvus vescus]
MSGRDPENEAKGDANAEIEGGVDADTDGNATADENDLQPLLEGASAGTAAWAVGYALTYLLAGSTIRSDLRTEILESATGETLTAELVAWTYVNAHGVPTLIPQQGLYSLLRAEQNAVTHGGGNEWLLLILPPVVLALAGSAITARRVETLETHTDASIVGAMIAIGYLLATIVAVLVSTVPVEGGVIRPAPLESILIVGIVYPLTFGAVGGVLVRKFSRG